MDFVGRKKCVTVSQRRKPTRGTFSCYTMFLLCVACLSRCVRLQGIPHTVLAHFKSSSLIRLEKSLWRWSRQIFILLCSNQKCWLVKKKSMELSKNISVRQLQGKKLTSAWERSRTFLDGKHDICTFLKKKKKWKLGAGLLRSNTNFVYRYIENTV